MATYLLTWNPQKWPWKDIQDSIDEISKKGSAKFRWSCGNSKKIVKGDRVFLLRQGVEPRGICASGWVESSSYEEIHWREEKAKKGRTTRYVKVRWDVLLNADTESIFPREWLNDPPLSEVNWNTQISGINIRSEVADVLEERWEDFLDERGQSFSLFGRESQTKRKMKGTKYFVLTFALFLSLMDLSSFAHGQTQAGKQTSRLVVSFYSICCGIDHKAKEKLDKFIKQYEKAQGRRLTKAAIRWGREGEIDYCLTLSQLSLREQKRFISKVRLVLKKSKLVHVNENAACQSER